MIINARPQSRVLITRHHLLRLQNEHAIKLLLPEQRLYWPCPTLLRVWRLRWNQKLEWGQHPHFRPQIQPQWLFDCLKMRQISPRMRRLMRRCCLKWMGGLQRCTSGKWQIPGQAWTGHPGSRYFACRQEVKYYAGSLSGLHLVTCTWRQPEAGNPSIYRLSWTGFRYLRHVQNCPKQVRYIFK